AMTGMLNVLLDINQIEAGVVQPEPIDFVLNDLFSRMRDEFTYQAQAQHLELRVRACALRVHSDPRLLEQMVRNLLANAMKYTRTGRILLACRRTGAKMRLEVWDTGIGIAGDELHAIFDEFHQIDNAARERSKGLGLGLSIVQRLGALLDHDIGVRSKLGKGSVFSIEIPLATHLAASAVAGLPEQQREAATTGKVIIVEDDLDVRDLLEQLLKAGGHRVREAANGMAALALVAKGAIRPDLVLADYNLPGALDGLEVVEKMRNALNHPLPGIILTGDISKATQARIAGSDCVLLSKPVKAQELTAAIEALLKKDEASFTLPSSDPTATSDAVIIVVDDDEDVRMSIRDVLEADGHVVEDFPDAETYLASYRSDREGCLLLDAGLPGIGGIELLGRLQEVGSPMPTIMLTGSSDLTLAISAMKAGACDFIEKPASRDALMESIARALALSRDASMAHDLEEKASRLVAQLTPRQHEIMGLVLAGHPSKNIAADLGVSQRTVENHRAAIMHTMDAKSLPELARRALAADRKGPPVHR
ncbi:MAG: response regulator, partial [Sphingobium sp.]